MERQLTSIGYLDAAANMPGDLVRKKKKVELAWYGCYITARLAYLLCRRGGLVDHYENIVGRCLLISVHAY